MSQNPKKQDVPDGADIAAAATTDDAAATDAATTDTETQDAGAGKVIMATANTPLYESSSETRFPANVPVRIHKVTGWIESQVAAGLMTVTEE